MRAVVVGAGTLTNTSPETVSRLTLLPNTGGPGGTPSSVNAFEAAVASKSRAGLGSGFPDGSIARTTNVWAPEPSVGVVNGDTQVAKAPSSRLHSNVDPGSSEENVDVGRRIRRLVRRP